MGRRRKHDGDSGLASDQIPGQNQNNIKVPGLVTLYCISTRPLAVIHRGTVPYESKKCKRRVSSLHSGWEILVSSRIRDGTLREERYGVQAIEMQRGLSPDKQPDLTETKCLILNGRHETA